MVCGCSPALGNTMTPVDSTSYPNWPGTSSGIALGHQHGHRLQPTPWASMRTKAVAGQTWYLIAAQIFVMASGGCIVHPKLYGPHGCIALGHQCGPTTDPCTYLAMTGATDINTGFLGCSRAQDQDLASSWSLVASWPFMSACYSPPSPLCLSSHPTNHSVPPSLLHPRLVLSHHNGD